MTRYTLDAACLPDLDAERRHLTALLPPGTLVPGQLGLPAEAGCAVTAWAKSGLMGLTGLPGGPPLAPAAPVLTRVALAAAALSALAAAHGARLRPDLAAILAGRAGLHSWQRRGTTSLNGTCRLLPAPDGWLAISLSRPDDLLSVPALLCRADLDGGPWAAIAAAAAAGSAAGLAGRAQLLGIPAAVLGGPAPAAVRFRRHGPPGQPGPSGGAPGLVLDLSALWAGPLCASLLRQAGWRTLKVEDVRRPDATRAGPAEFYASLHAGGAAIQLDLRSAAGRAELLRLAGQAQLVIEGSRPRALRGFGLVAEDWLAAAPARTWVSITGYGRDDPEQRVAFGDDAAIGGGLAARAADGTPVFCGDAIADPLTGMFAALAALAAVAAGGGLLADVAMTGVCADLARPGGTGHAHEVSRDGPGWTVSHGSLRQPVRPPSAPLGLQRHEPQC